MNAGASRLSFRSVAISEGASASWLLRYGFEPVLIERAPVLRTGGYIIDFWGPGFDVAEQMGLLPALRKLYILAGELAKARFAELQLGTQHLEYNSRR